MDSLSSVPDMEQAVVENPNDTHLWLKLAYKKMNEARYLTVMCDM